MAETASPLLERLARRQALEAFTIEAGPAWFENPQGERTSGTASVDVSRSSIAIRFAADGGVAVPTVDYGHSNGGIGSADGTWSAARVSDAGRTSEGEHLFGTIEIVVGRDAAQKAAMTRLLYAGAAWSGTGVLDGRRVLIRPLSGQTVSHHDQRLAISIEGDLDAAQIAAIEQASAFVSGHGVELLRVESYSADGTPLRIWHHRGYRRLGRGHHCPFTEVPDEHRMRAWTALAGAIPRLLKEGVPIDVMIDYVSLQNQGVEIHAAAAPMMLAAMTAIHHRSHGRNVAEGAASRRAELARVNRELALGLSDTDLDRFEKLRRELLDTGFFQESADAAARALTENKPERGNAPRMTRAQRDIKFIRDVSHTIVLRLCGYSGPFYDSEYFAVRDLRK